MHKWLYLLGMGILFLACRTEISMDDYDHQSLPVVNALLVAGDTLELQVTLSSAVNGIEIDCGDIASIEVLCNDEPPIEFSYTHHGIYQSNHVVKDNAIYLLSIFVEGFDTITKRVDVPQVPELSDVQYIVDNWVNDEQKWYPSLLATFKTHPDSIQYYEARLKYLSSDRIDSIETPTYIYFFSHYDDFVEHSDPILITEGLPTTVFSNENISGDEYSMVLNFTGGGVGTSPFQLEFRAVTKDYYTYIKSLYVYDIGRYPDTFLATPSYSQIFSNVETGYGIIAGYSSTCSEMFNKRGE